MGALPLRLLVLLPVLITITVGLAIFAIFVDGVEQRRRLADVDRELARAAQTSPAVSADEDTGTPRPTAGAAAAEPPLTAPPVQVILGPDGRVVAEPPSSHPFSAEERQRLVAAAAEDGEPVTLTVDESNHRVLLRSNPGGQVAVTALRLDTVDVAIAELRRTLAVGAVAIVALVGVVVWVLTTRITRHVGRLTDRAERISLGELDVGLHGEGVSRETTRLAESLERMRLALRTDVVRSEQLAAESDHARSVMARFLADMANEVRTPLSALQGYSELYRDGRLVEDGDVRRAMDRIGKESGRLHRLAADMLALSQGRYRADEIPDFVELHRVAENVVDDLHAAFPDHPVRLHSLVPHGPYVRGRAERIHQALLNLGANACQHSPDGKSVDITLRQDDTWARVNVIDHGRGVTHDQVELIFQPFVRSGNPTWDGAGLGLTVAREIARENEGHIEVGQTKGGGATFVLTLPLA